MIAAPVAYPHFLARAQAVRPVITASRHPPRPTRGMSLPSPPTMPSLLPPIPMPAPRRRRQAERLLLRAVCGFAEIEHIPSRHFKRPSRECGSMFEMALQAHPECLRPIISCSCRHKNHRQELWDRKRSPIIEMKYAGSLNGRALCGGLPAWPRGTFYTISRER